MRTSMTRRRRSCNTTYHSTTVTCRLRVHLAQFLLLVWISTTALSSIHRVQGIHFRIPGRRRGDSSSGSGGPTQGRRRGMRHHNANVGRDVDPVLLATSTAPAAASTEGMAVEDVAASIEQAAAAAADYAKNLGFLNNMPDFVKVFSKQLWNIVLYKPPVGIVSCYAVFRLLWTGRIFRLFPKPPASSKDSVEDDLHRQTKKRDNERLVGRSFILDRDDEKYNLYGGVERIRRRLCALALAHLADQHKAAADQDPTYDEDDLDLDRFVLNAAIDALTVSVPPGTARVSLVQKLIFPLAHLEHVVETMDDMPPSTHGKIPITSKEFRQLVSVSSMTVELHAMDALLRVCRDRLLKTTFRLARTRDHWKRRVKSAKSLTGVLKRLFSGVIEGDRLRLAYVTAAYNDEVNRLGQIAALLMERPSELPESHLLAVLKSANLEKRARKAAEALAKKENAKTFQQHIQSLNMETMKENFHGVKMPDLSISKWSKYSIRLSFDGKGFPLKILKADMVARDFGPGAVATLLSATDNDTWMPAARDWTDQARRGLCSVLKEALQGSVDSKAFNEKDFMQIEEHWCTQKNAPNTDIVKQWQLVLDYADSLPSWRRVGEGKTVRLMDGAFFGFIQKLNIFGVPKAALTVGAAHYFHHWINPRWPAIKKDGIAISQAVGLIVRERFWAPVKGIWNDLMHKNEGMMSALSVDGEQASLDNMLRDLGYGDGTEETRTDALVRAAAEYEQGLKSGVFKSVLGGQLVRLLLVQVQQLKVGLLSALGTIDALMKGNQIHFQFLAALPAILIATYGTRFFFRALYNIRARDLRPISVAHAEMSNYLSNIEAIILLADQDVVTDSGQGSKRSGRGKGEKAVVRTNLQPTELGELLLNLHRYLILLEYGSPPFQIWMCDAIHSSLQEILGGSLQRLDTARHVSWLNIVQQKHQELLK